MGEGELVHLVDLPGGLPDVSELVAKAGVNISGAPLVGRRPGVFPP